MAYVEKVIWLLLWTQCLQVEVQGQVQVETCRCEGPCLLNKYTSEPAEAPAEVKDTVCDGMSASCATLEDVPVTIALVPQDSTASEFTAQVICFPTKGSLTLLDEALALFEYVPDLNVNSGPKLDSTDVFTYRIEELDQMFMVVLTIVPVNDQPLVQADTFYPSNEYPEVVSANTDLTFELGQGLEGLLDGTDDAEEATRSLAFHITSQPSHGFACTATTAVGTALGGSGDVELGETAVQICEQYAWDGQQRGQFLYVPDPGYTGDDEFTYVVSDLISQLENDADDTYKTQCGRVVVTVGSYSSDELPNVKDIPHAEVLEDATLTSTLYRSPATKLSYPIRFEILEDCGGAEYCKRGTAEALCGGYEVTNYTDCDAGGKVQNVAAQAYFRYTPQAHCHGTDSFKYVLYGEQDGVWLPGPNEAMVTVTISSVLEPPTVLSHVVQAPMSDSALDVSDSVGFNVTELTPVAIVAFDWDDYDCTSEVDPETASQLKIRLNTTLLQGTLLDASGAPPPEEYEVRSVPPSGEPWMLYYSAPPFRRGTGIDTLYFTAVDLKGTESTLGEVRLDVGCAAGYKHTEGSVCVACPAGTYSLHEDARSCIPCGPGQYNPNKALGESCFSCSAMEYQNEPGQTACKLCPAGSGSADSTERDSVLECTCTQGHYGEDGNVCQQCPNMQGAPGVPSSDAWTKCERAGLRWPLPLEGFWVDTQEGAATEVEIRECAVKESCLEIHVVVRNGTDEDQQYEEAMDKIENGWTCEVGYQGVACAECCSRGSSEPGCTEVGAADVYYRLNGMCEACPKASSGFFIGMSVMCALFLPVLFTIADKVRSVPGINIALSFAQVTSMFPKMDLNWPDEVTTAFGYFSGFSFNIELIHPECAIENWSSLTKWAMLMNMPVLLLGLLIARAAFARFYMEVALQVKAGVQKYTPFLLTPPPGKDTPYILRLPSILRYKAALAMTYRMSTEEFVHFARFQIRIFLTFMHLGYVFLCGATLEFMDCAKDNASSRSDGEGARWFLVSDPSVECFVFNDGSDWAWYFPWAVIAILAYPIGIFCLFAVTMYLLRGKLDHPAAQEILGFLFCRFHPEWYAFELVLMARKALVVMSELMFANQNITEDSDESGDMLADQIYISLRQALLAMTVLLASLLVQFHASPFDNRRLDQMEGISVSFQFFALFAGLIFLSDKGEESTLSTTFAAFLSWAIVTAMILSYFFFGIAIILDVYPDFFSITGRKEKSSSRPNSPKAGADQAKKGLDSLSISGAHIAHTFVESMRVSQAGKKVLTAAGRRLALRARGALGKSAHKDAMATLETMVEARSQNRNVWVSKKETHPVEKVLRPNMALGILQAMSQRHQGKNEAVTILVNRVFSWSLRQRSRSVSILSTPQIDTSQHDELHGGAAENATETATGTSTGEKAPELSAQAVENTDYDVLRLQSVESMRTEDLGLMRHEGDSSESLSRPLAGSMSSKIAVIVGVGSKHDKGGSCAEDFPACARWGFGGALAFKFSSAGFHVVLLARRADVVEAIAQEVRAQGGEATSILCDVTNDESVTAAFARASELGSVDVMIYNCAPPFPPELMSLKEDGGFGFGKFPQPHEVDPQYFNAAFDVGVTGCVRCVKQVVPAMLAKGKGTILLSGATMALRGGPTFSFMSPIKFALRSYGQSMYQDYAPKGVHVAHVVIDGVIDSPNTRSWTNNVMDANDLADEFLHIHNQKPSVWSYEVQVGPSTGTLGMRL
ncbi:hypothetical protein CYMTET_12172 [Cymbomonas tetramitiformis]|uniref:Tyrosine-protein kinase ephrin type A/B receptor-like domain-containing protein n=1 Tax=Cymbomonas tetramitiformis TaxID=36881 RepID=A0AAE0GL72_9CHLO|nr:hypothetical protein CYMTET_12172 [Cymbomonas tetramitiformis]